MKALFDIWGKLPKTLKDLIITIFVAVVISFLTTLLTSWLTSRRLRRERVWGFDLKRVQKVLDLAGKMYKEVRYNNSKEYKKEVVLPLLDEFERNSNFLLKYKGLNEAIFEFPNGVYYFLYEEVTPEDDKNLVDSYTKLIEACKYVLKGKGK